VPPPHPLFVTEEKPSMDGAAGFGEESQMAARLCLTLLLPPRRLHTLCHVVIFLPDKRIKPGCGKSMATTLYARAPAATRCRHFCCLRTSPILVDLRRSSKEISQFGRTSYGPLLCPIAPGHHSPPLWWSSPSVSSRREVEGRCEEGGATLLEYGGGSTLATVVAVRPVVVPWRWRSI
jgi:hypothetical protein